MGANETSLDATETASAAARLALRAEALSEAVQPFIGEIRRINETEPWRHDQYGNQFREGYLGIGDGESAVDSILGSCEGICDATYQLGETAGMGAISSELVDEEDGARFDRLVGNLEGSVADLGEAGQEQRAAAAEHQADPVAAEEPAGAPAGAAGWVAAPAAQAGFVAAPASRVRRAAATGTDASRAGGVFRALRRGEPVAGFRGVARRSGPPAGLLANRIARPDEAATSRRWDAGELTGSRGAGEPARFRAAPPDQPDPLTQGFVQRSGRYGAESMAEFTAGSTAGPGAGSTAGSMAGPGVESDRAEAITQPVLASDGPSPAGAEPMPAERHQPGQDGEMGRVAESAGHSRSPVPPSVAGQPLVAGEAGAPGGFPVSGVGPRGPSAPVDSPVVAAKHKTPAATGESTVAG